MSGHSKWHQIRHKKAKEDLKKGQIFSKLSRAITVAAKEGGGSPETNAALETAIQKAKEYNMPAGNIERAIKKGIGELGEVQYERVTYEGYGPAGVAILVSVMTDNKNRTAAEIRHLFGKHNGNLGTAGCVEWMFERKGYIHVDKANMKDEDNLLSLAIEAGAEDMKTEDTYYEIVIVPTETKAVSEILKKNGIVISSFGTLMLPKNVVKVEDKEEAKKILRLMDALEDHDDTQEVYANFDIPDEILEEIEA